MYIIYKTYIKQFIKNNNLKNYKNLKFFLDLNTNLLKCGNCGYSFRKICFYTKNNFLKLEFYYSKFELKILY